MSGACNTLVPLSTTPQLINVNSVILKNQKNCSSSLFTYSPQPKYEKYYVIEVFWLVTLWNNTVVENCNEYFSVYIGENTVQTFCIYESSYPFYSNDYPIKILVNHAYLKNMRSNLDITMKARLIYTRNLTVDYKGQSCRKNRLNKKKGLISTLHYPHGYQSNTKCTLKLSVGKGNRISLHIMDMMFVSYGVMCTNIDDNLRIRVADNYDTRFEYATDVSNENKYYCGKKQPFLIHVKDHEYVMVQFNSFHSTVAHRGFVIGYKIEAAEENSGTTNETSYGIIIGIFVTVTFILTTSILISVYVIRKKLRRQRGDRITLTTTCQERNQTANKNDAGANADNDDNDADDDRRKQQNSANSSTISMDISGGNAQLCVANLQRLNALFMTSSSRQTLNEEQKED